MEAMQDKQIREKLNSLDTLPEGYVPSLDSKWELLRGGKPEKKSTPLYFWYATAATLLLLLGLSLGFWRTEKQSNPANIARQEVQSEKTLPEVSEHYKAEASNKLIEPIMSNTKSGQKNGIIKAPKTQRSSQNPAISKADSTVTSATESLMSQETSVLITAENPKVAPKKRNRYVELDFAAPETPQRLPQPVQTAQLQVKVRLLPQTSEPDRATVQGESPIRFQHTF